MSWNDAQPGGLVRSLRERGTASVAALAQLAEGETIYLNLLDEGFPPRMIFVTRVEFNDEWEEIPPEEVVE